MLNNREIYQRIDELLKEKGVKAASITTDLGMKNKGWLYDIENGRSKTSIKVLVGLSELYDVSLDYLAFGKKRMYESKVHTELISKFDQLSPEMQMRILGIIDGVLMNNKSDEDIEKEVPDSQIENELVAN